MMDNVTRLGDWLPYGQLFKVCGKNYLAQITHIHRQFLYRYQNLSFFYWNNFWSTFKDIWRLCTGHTGRRTKFRVPRNIQVSNFRRNLSFSFFRRKNVFSFRARPVRVKAPARLDPSRRFTLSSSTRADTWRRRGRTASSIGNVTLCELALECVPAFLEVSVD